MSARQVSKLMELRFRMVSGFALQGLENCSRWRCPCPDFSPDFSSIFRVAIVAGA
jgi:hypothetical protein